MDISLDVYSKDIIFLNESLSVGYQHSPDHLQITKIPTFNYTVICYVNNTNFFANSVVRKYHQ